jgi:hypothetical protein
LVEQFAKPSAAILIYHLHERNSTEEVSMEVVVIRPILITCAMPNAVRQYSLQSIVVRSRHVQSLVHDDARKPLANPMLHDTRLSVMDGEAFLHDRGAHMMAESFDDSMELAISGKRQVIGISGVNRRCGSRQPG